MRCKETKKSVTSEKTSVNTVLSSAKPRLKIFFRRFLSGIFCYVNHNRYICVINYVFKNKL